MQIDQQQHKVLLNLPQINYKNKIVLKILSFT